MIIRRTSLGDVNYFRYQDCHSFAYGSNGQYRLVVIYPAIGTGFNSGYIVRITTNDPAIYTYRDALYNLKRVSQEEREQRAMLKPKRVTS